MIVNTFITAPKACAFQSAFFFGVPRENLNLCVNPAAAPPTKPRQAGRALWGIPGGGKQNTKEIPHRGLAEQPRGQTGPPPPSFPRKVWESSLGELKHDVTSWSSAPPVSTLSSHWSLVPVRRIFYFFLPAVNSHLWQLDRSWANSDRHALPPPPPSGQP